MAKRNKKKKKHRFLRFLLGLGIFLTITALLYMTCIYSNIPFIKKWRSIYIQTAMTTNSHQWLATLFIPMEVIDEVMAELNEGLEDQKDLNSSWGDEDIVKPAADDQNVLGAENLSWEDSVKVLTPELVDASTDIDKFFELYWELDSESFRAYLEANPELTEDGYDKIVIKDLKGNLDLKTSEGDDILAVNIPNNLFIIGVSARNYKGKMAMIKDPSQVNLYKASTLGKSGKRIAEFCEAHDAILGINASGFVDPNGEGSGGKVRGCLVIDGVDYGKHETKDAWKFIGMKKNNRLYCKEYDESEIDEYRWGVEFYPGLIINGEDVVKGDYCMGIQPRTTIGQAKDGTVMMLVIDGRQPGYSLGCSVKTCTEIMFRYKAYQGMNLDGGSSAVMYYDGAYITKASSLSGLGRKMPDALLVNKAE